MLKTIVSYTVILAVNPFYWIVLCSLIRNKITLKKITRLIFFTILLQLLCYPYTEILAFGDKQYQSISLNLGIGIFLTLLFAIKPLTFIKQQFNNLSINKADKF